MSSLETLHSPHPLPPYRPRSSNPQPRPSLHSKPQSNLVPGCPRHRILLATHHARWSAHHGRSAAFSRMQWHARHPCSILLRAGKRLERCCRPVHAKGGYIYAQLWNAGRASIPQHTGLPTVSASATLYDGDEMYAYPPPFTSSQVKYADFPPTELSLDGRKKQISDYVNSPKLVIEQCGFDGIEMHRGNGYLPEQFLSNNINTRADDYGDSPEKLRVRAHGCVGGSDSTR